MKIEWEQIYSFVSIRSDIAMECLTFAEEFIGFFFCSNYHLNVQHRRQIQLNRAKTRSAIDSIASTFEHLNRCGSKCNWTLGMLSTSGWANPTRACCKDFQAKFGIKVNRNWQRFANESFDFITKTKHWHEYEVGWMGSVIRFLILESSILPSFVWSTESPSPEIPHGYQICSVELTSSRLTYRRIPQLSQPTQLLSSRSRHVAYTAIFSIQTINNNNVFQLFLFAF